MASGACNLNFGDYNDQIGETHAPAHLRRGQVSGGWWSIRRWRGTGWGGRCCRRWVGLNPDRLRYEMIFTDTDTIPADRLDEARRFVAG